MRVRGELRSAGDEGAETVLAGQVADLEQPLDGFAPASLSKPHAPK